MNLGGISKLSLRGLQSLRDERQNERRKLEATVQRAIDIFNAHSSGISELVLHRMLVEEGARESNASTATYELQSSGLAVKNWATGFLSHTPNQGR